MWSKRLRQSITFSFIISIVVNIGMWFERFVIIVTSLHRDYLPSSWTMFSPTFVDIGIYVGTIGFFFVLFLLYARTFPVIAQAEVKSILKSSGQFYKLHRDEGGKNPAPQKVVKAAAVVTSSEEVVVDLSENKNSLLSALGIFDAATQKVDDLKLISGVGPKLEETLNEIGIFSFEQVSKMTEKEYDLLDSLLDSFKGRALRDDWAGQATNLKNQG